MKKVAIIGTHGTGKSTLSMYLACQYKRLGRDCKIVQEVARICPFQLNENFSLEGALWIYHTHRMKELEAKAIRCCTLVCDRSCIDSFLYLRNIMPVFPLEAEAAYQTAYIAMNSYDQIIFIEPNTELQADRVRSMDIEFQSRIHFLFEDMLSSFPDHSKILRVKSSDVFENNIRLTKKGEVVFKYDKELVDSYASANC